MSNTLPIINGTASLKDWESWLGLEMGETGDWMTGLVTVDAGIARAIRTHNLYPRQRRMLPSNVTSIALDMRAGTYLNVANPKLAFFIDEETGNPNFYLIDSNHTFEAIAVTGVSQSFYIRVYHVKSMKEVDDLYAVIDSGKSRNMTAVGIARASGYPVQLSAMMKSILRTGSQWGLSKMDPMTYGSQTGMTNHRITWEQEHSAIAKSTEQWWLDLKVANKEFFKLAKQGRFSALVFSVLKSGSTRHQQIMWRLMNEILNHAQMGTQPAPPSAVWGMMEAIMLPISANSRSAVVYSMINSWHAYVKNNPVDPSATNRAIKVQMAEPVL